jgi:hypothetical protein
MKSDLSVIIAQNHLGTIECPERPCVLDEPRKLADVKEELIDEYYVDTLELRGIDLGDEVLQVLAYTSEPEGCERGEDSACERRWTSGSLIRARSRGCEFDDKPLEPGQCGQARGHCFRWNVTSIRRLAEAEFDKVIGRQKKFR